MAREIIWKSLTILATSFYIMLPRISAVRNHLWVINISIKQGGKPKS